MSRFHQVICPLLFFALSLSKICSLQDCSTPANTPPPRTRTHSEHTANTHSFSELLKRQRDGANNCMCRVCCSFPVGIPPAFPNYPASFLSRSLPVTLILLPDTWSVSSLFSSRFVCSLIVVVVFFIFISKANQCSVAFTRVDTTQTQSDLLKCQQGLKISVAVVWTGKPDVYICRLVIQ